ncbi:HNH endonuclease [Leptospira bouyouniensis]|uniref:HNH endonuclease n=1 Tax=Leptospira bouyouniensis TaxID=2484911 RepID=A0ABY2KZD0_9LEPT|nr:HNH endonuclease [Leptospira bouyouniensis]TGK45939.1 HNH endonuclease [Leptospira bouyouniensis]
MITCIICRKLKPEGTDEHVFPDSIEGYYHIYNVCKDCNSNLGSYADVKLTDHLFIKFIRFHRQASGKSKTIPNPFAGTHTLEDDDDSKVQILIGTQGELITYALPKIKGKPNFKDGFSVTVDKKDEDKLPGIIQKICERNGLNVSNYQQEKQIITVNSKVKCTLSIDTSQYFLALLKIAYEFASDQIPSYLNDPLSIKIAKVLESTDFVQMEELNLFYGNPFESSNYLPYKFLFENGSKSHNHILSLIAIENRGLYCFVKIYDTFFTTIKLSDNIFNLQELAIIGINDLEKKKFIRYNLKEYFDELYSPTEFRFQYYFPGEKELLDFQVLQSQPEFSFENIDGSLPLYNKNGEIIYSDIHKKLSQESLIHEDLGDFQKAVITRIILDQELYIKIKPSDKLVQIVSVNVEHYRK